MRQLIQLRPHVIICFVQDAWMDGSIKSSTTTKEQHVRIDACHSNSSFMAQRTNQRIRQIVQYVEDVVIQEYKKPLVVSLHT